MSYSFVISPQNIFITSNCMHISVSELFSDNAGLGAVRDVTSVAIQAPEFGIMIWRTASWAQNFSPY